MIIMADRNSRRLSRNRIDDRPHAMSQITVYKSLPAVAWRFLSALARLLGVS